MKITSNQVAAVLGARLERLNEMRRGDNLSALASPTSDRALFSARSEDIRAGMEAARTADLSEEGRLAALATKIRAERYYVPSEEIAEALMRDLGR